MRRIVQKGQEVKLKSIYFPGCFIKRSSVQYAAMSSSPETNPAPSSNAILTSLQKLANTPEFQAHKNKRKEDRLAGQSGIRIDGDVICHLPGSEEELAVAPGDIFTMEACISPKNPLLLDKPEDEQRIFLESLLSSHASERSRMILGAIDVLPVLDVDKTDTNDWRVAITFRNANPQAIRVPSEIEMFTLFEKKGKPLDGYDLVEAAAQLGEDLQGVYLVCDEGRYSFADLLNMLDQEESGSFLFDSSNSLFPRRVFLPYTHEMGLVRPGAVDSLADLPPRRKGLLDTHTDWYPQRIPVAEDEVALYKTIAHIGFPPGIVGLIDQGVSRHSLSILLHDGHVNGHRYFWDIIGEHSGSAYADGFFMDLWEKLAA